MSIFSSVATGADTRRDLRRGQRQQMAEAFAQFKRNNPLATVADFQSFIDSFSGGDNYIAGGAPGESVLRRIEASNRAKEAERLKALAFKRYQERRAIEKDLMPEIQNYLIDLKKTPDLRGNPVYNFTQATEDFLAMRPELKDLGINFNAMMTNEAREQAIAERVNQNLQLGENYFKTLPLGDEGDYAAFQQVANLPDAVAQQVFSNIQKTKKNEYQTLVNQEKQKVTDFYRQLVADNTVDPDNIRNMVIAEFANSPFANDIFPDQVKGSDGKTMIPVPQAWEKKYIEQARENREKDISDKKATAIGSINTALVSPDVRKRIASVLQTQGNDAAKKTIMDAYATTIPKDLFEGDEASLDTYLQNTLDAIKGEILASQERARTNAITTNSGKTREAVSAGLEANIAKATSVWSDSKLGASLSGGNQNMPIIAQSLAKMFYFDDTTTNNLLSWIQGQDPERLKTLDANQLAQEATAYLTSINAPTWADRSSQIREISNAFIPLESQTFQQYKTNLKSSIQDATNSADTALNTILETITSASTRDELLSAVRKLGNLKGQVDREKDIIKQVVQSEEDTKLNWLSPEGDLWNQEEVDAIINSFNANDIIAQIQENIGSLETKIDAMDDVSLKGTEDRNKPDFVADPDKSRFMNMLNEAAQSGEFDLEWQAFKVGKGLTWDKIPALDMGRIDNWLSKMYYSVFSTEGDLRNREIIEKFADSDSIKEYFKDNPEKWEVFKASDNPVQMIKDDPTLREMATHPSMDINLD